MQLSRWLIVLGLLFSFQLPGQAAVKVELDLQTLNDLLAALTDQEIEVPLTGDRTLKVRLDELKLTALDPSAGDASQGHLLTRLKLSITDLGVSVSAKPRLSLVVAEEAGLSVLEMRFEEVLLPLPLGKMNIAAFLPPIRIPADGIFQLDGAGGDVNVRSKLAKVRMGREVLQLEFDVQIVP